MINPKYIFIRYAKQLRHRLSPYNVRNKYIIKNVPYFSQWESRELNGHILNNPRTTQDDPKWRQSGAKSTQEYVDWSWIGCGMACTKMLLAHKINKIIPLVELGKKCAKYGGYTYPVAQSRGMSYAPYVQFLYAEFGIKACLATVLTEQEIIKALNDNNYVIASVSPDIRIPKSQPVHKGGHLILLLGYSLDGQQFYFHNPSGIGKDTQEYATISFADFGKFFGSRGIIIPA